MNTIHYIDKYSLPLRVLNRLAVGFYMADIDPDAVDKYDLYPLNKAVDMIALFFVLLRLPARAKGPISSSVEGFKNGNINFHTWYILACMSRCYR